MPPALLCCSASVKSCTHAQQVPQKAACQWDYWVGRNLAWGELYPFLFFLECDLQGSQKIDLKKGEMLTYKNVKESKRCSGSQHKTQNERKISYSYTRTWLHFTSFTHTTIPLPSVLLLNRQTVSWESSLQELVRDIISFLTFTLLCFRVSRHNCQIFSQGLEAASQS